MRSTRSPWWRRTNRDRRRAGLRGVSREGPSSARREPNGKGLAIGPGPRAMSPASSSAPAVRQASGPAIWLGPSRAKAGINSKELGAIQIADRFSLIEVPEARADDIMAALRATTIRGRKVPVRRDRDQA